MDESLIGAENLENPGHTDQPGKLARANLEDLAWASVGNGRLAVYHRPGRRTAPLLRSSGCSLVVTLLSELEGSQRIGEGVERAGMEWMWLPLRNGSPPKGERHEMIARALPELSRRLDEGQSIMIHCSAGIHRTGMIALSLLRFRGLSEDQGMSIIGQSRRFTFEGIQTKHKVYAAFYAGGETGL